MRDRFMLAVVVCLAGLFGVRAAHSETVIRARSIVVNATTYDGTGNLDQNVTDVQILADRVNTLAVSAGNITETDPIFNASTAAGITTVDIDAWNAKQDALDFTPENVDNKTATVTNSTTLYPTSKAVQDYVGNQGYAQYLSAGALAEYVCTNNGNGTISIGNVDVTLYDNATFVGVPKKYTLAGLTNQTLTDGVTNYLVGDYNSGTPILRVITDVSLITESDVVPICTIYRNGIYLHVIHWDALGRGLSNKLNQSIVKTQRYRRESGLTIAEHGTRNLTLTSGLVWVGAVRQTVAALDTVTDNAFLWYHSSGVWTQSVTTQYNNTQYDDGTNLQTLGSNRYAVNWIFRGVESQKHLYIVLGTGDYTSTQAQTASVPPVPAAISSHAVLVAKLIVQKDGTTAAFPIQSAFDTQFSFAAASSHEDLTGLLGGSTGDHYHLTGAQHTLATQYASGTQDGLLSSSDYGTFNSKLSSLALDGLTDVNAPSPADQNVLKWVAGNSAWEAGTISSSQWDNVTGGINYAGGNIGVGSTAPTVKLDVVGDVKLTGRVKGTSKQRGWSMGAPASLYATNSTTSLAWIPTADITLTRVRVKCGYDPVTEMNLNLKYCDDINTLANAVTICALDTTSGSADITSFTNATIPAGKAVYLAWDAAPDGAQRVFDLILDGAE